MKLVFLLTLLILLQSLYMGCEMTLTVIGNGSACAAASLCGKHDKGTLRCSVLLVLIHSRKEAARSYCVKELDMPILETEM
jgi:hypothetical protein